MAPKLYPVIISGGAGTRLWPLSTEDKPKQFHAFRSQHSLLQESAKRMTIVDGVELMSPIVLCNQRHVELVKEQLNAVGRPAAAIVSEPFGRNTAAVAMAAALVVDALNPGALMLLMPSDHLIEAPEAFAAAIAGAVSFVRDRIVLFGVRPTGPETGFGYIEAGDRLDGDLSSVVRFIEKPDLARATTLLADDRYLWNAGIFLFSPQTIIAEIERYAPEVAEITRQSLRLGEQHDGVVDLDAVTFARCPSISLDYAVMEHTDRAAVTPIETGWADIGSWNSLWDQTPKDADGNVRLGDTIVIDTKDCMVWSEDKTVAIVGLEDLIVVQTAEAVLVLPKSRAQDVRQLVDQLRNRRPKPTSGS